MVVVTKSLFWTLRTLLRPRVWAGDRDMEARGPNEGTSGGRGGGGKHSNTILDHWSSIADCIRVSLILSILQCKDISAAQMEFTQICSTLWWVWVHNTMCTLICSIIRYDTRICCALSQWFLWSRGCRYIKTPHVAPWTDHLSNKMQSQTTGTGAGKKIFRLHLFSWTIKWDELGLLFHLFRGAGAMSEILKAWSLFTFFCHSPAVVLKAFLFC